MCWNAVRSEEAVSAAAFRYLKEGLLMREIRIGIIGTGIIAHEHLKRYGEIPGVKVVAACDLQEAKLNAFCDEYGIEARYTDYRKLLKRDDMEAVDVCLHNNLHAPISVAVMASGRDCYCEKPMAGSYADALAMYNAADRLGRRLHIQLGMLYGAQMIAARRFVDAGLLGDIYHARSYGYRRRGRPFVDGYAEKEFDSSHWAGHGALFDMGVYHISQLLYLLGMPRVRSVSGGIYQKLDMPAREREISGFDVEELGTGYVKFEGGLTMDIIESWAIHGGAFPASSLYGSRGGLTLAGRSNPNGLTYFSELEGYPCETDVNVGQQDYYLNRHDPGRWMYENSQTMWIGILRGECEDIRSRDIALETMLISEGIFLSDQLGREVRAEEIPQLSRSNAIKRQQTEFGLLEYPDCPFYTE